MTRFLRDNLGLHLPHPKSVFLFAPLSGLVKANGELDFMY